MTASSMFGPKWPTLYLKISYVLPHPWFIFQNNGVTKFCHQVFASLYILFLKSYEEFPHQRTDKMVIVFVSPYVPTVNSLNRNE